MMSENSRDFRGSCQHRGWSWTLWIAQTFFFFFLPPSILDIHAVRPHRGQIEVAFRFRSLLDSDHHPSEIAGLDKFVWVGSWVLCVLGRLVMCCLFSSPQPSPALPCPESHRFCDRVQDAYTLRCCPQVKSRNRSPAKACSPNSEGGGVEKEERFRKSCRGQM